MLCAECLKEIPDKQEIIFHGTSCCKDCYKKAKTILLITQIICGLIIVGCVIYVCYYLGKMSK